jgi:hypothetical protein
MGLKRFIKKARKAIGLPAITLGNAAKIGAGLATGGIAGGLAVGVLKSKLKSAAVGGIKQVVRSKAQKAQLKRAMVLAPPTVVGIAASQTMPGGAPLRGVRVTTPRSKPKAATGGKKRKSPAKRRAAATKAPSAKKRTPPKGGLDLKALSASWKAAGKPGTWQGWISSHK